MRKVFLLIGLLALAAVSGCESRRTVARLDDIQSFLQDRPDSALTALRSIPESELSSKRLRARYSLLNAMALHKCYIDTADLSVIAPADRYYARHGSAWDKMKTLHQKGIIQMNGGDYQSAVISLTAAATYIDQAGDWFNGGLICISLCQLYNKLHDNNEELSWAIRAENYYQKVDRPIYYQDSRIKHAIALNNLGRYQEAVDIYHSLLDDEELDEANRLSVMRHLAYTQSIRKNNNPQEADSLFTKVLQETGSLPEGCWDVYALASEWSGNRKRAESIFSQLDTTDREVFYTYSRFLYERGEYQNAYDHLILSIAGQTEMLNVALTQAAHKAQRDHSESLRRETERKVFLLRILYLMGIALILLAGLVIYLVFRRRYERSRQDNELLAEAAETLLRQIESSESEKDRQLAAIRKEYIHMNQSSFKEVGRVYESLVSASRRGDSQRAILSQVKRLTEEIANDDSSESHLEKMIDASLGGLMHQFRADYPHLNERDYKMMAFIIAGFEMSTLAIFFGKSSISVPYTRKYRLKKKVESASPEISERYLPYF